MTTLKFPPNDEFMSFCRTEGFPNNYNDCLKATLQNDLGSSNPSIGDLMRAHFDRFQDDDYFSVANEAFRIIKSYGTDAHVYLPGIGVINGLTAGNYLDSAGTTAATVDNPVGLVLDANATLGPELTDNGDFSNGLTGWTLNAAATGVATIVNGALTYSSPHADYAEVKQLNKCVIGKTYQVEFDVVIAGATVNLITVTCGRATAYLSSGTGFTVGRKTARVVATHSDGFSISCRTDATIAIDNVSVKEVTGIHATQSTTSNKPILRYVSGKYYWSFDSTDVLTATFPAGYESATIINTSETGQVTYTAQNIVGAYDIRGAVIGSELVANGTFDGGIAGWAAGNANSSVGWDAGNQAITVTNSLAGFARGFSQTPFSVTAGKLYMYRIKVIAGSANVSIGALSDGSSSLAGSPALASGTTYTGILSPSATDSEAYFAVTVQSSTVGVSATVDSISLREITAKEYGQFIFRTGLTDSELAIIQSFANRLAGV